MRPLGFNEGFDYVDRINDRGDGLSILDYLARIYVHSSKEEWQDRLERGEVFLNGRLATSGVILKAGSTLVWHRPPWREPDVPLACGILHQDPDLLAVAKPSGLPSMPGGGYLDHTLFTVVRRRFPEATPAHRLGRGTSGIVLFAFTARARSALGEAMRRRRVVKIYRALASGIPNQDDFSIERAIGPVAHPLLGTVHASSPTGKHAVSHARVLERRENASLLEVRIETGRPHQIRIHLAAAGHPLVGDPLYAAGGGFKEPQTSLPGDCGYFLHAERVCLDHPTTGSPLDVWCSPPPMLRRTVVSACSR